MLQAIKTTITTGLEMGDCVASGSFDYLIGLGQMLKKAKELGYAIESERDGADIISFEVPSLQDAYIFASKWPDIVETLTLDEEVMCQDLADQVRDLDMPEEMIKTCGWTWDGWATISRGESLPDL
jgi:hypothetical protein